MSAEDSLASIIADVGKGNGAALQPGTCAYVQGKWRIYRGGQEQTSVVWLESASPRVGPCLLAIDTPRSGQSTIYVLGFTFPTDTRQIDTAKCVRAGSGGLCDVELRTGVVYENARYMAHYVPAVNDTVMVIWRGGEAYIMGGYPFGHNTVRVPEAPSLIELTRPLSYGTSAFPALTSRVWDTVRNDWVTADTRDTRLTTTKDAVFIYGGTTKSLVDKGDIEAITIQLGRRAQFSSMTDSVTLSFYRSDAEYLSDTDPAIQEGPYQVTITGKYKGDPIDLPLELGEALKQGGSLTVKASGPVTFLDSPANGHLNIKWRKAA